MSGCQSVKYFKLNKIKEFGVIYTPDNIVKFMIELSEIKLTDKILEPSVGTGNFIFGLLNFISSKYKLYGIELYTWLINHVNGYDIDEQSISILKMKLFNYFQSNFKFIPPSFHNFKCVDSLYINENIYYDLVIGNPPYVRTRNIDSLYLEKLRKNFISCKSGNIDLYYAFIEKFSLVAKKLCFITPNTWLKNKSAENLKNKIIFPKMNYLIDFKEKLVFSNEKTYTCIFLINSLENYYKYSNNIDSQYLTLIKEQVVNKNKSEKYVYSEIATLANKLYLVNKVGEDFIATYKDKKYHIEEGILAYYLKLTKIKNNNLDTMDYFIFPYDKNNKIISEEILKTRFPLAYNYLYQIKSELNKRDKGKVGKYEAWYAYGRKQGLHNIIGKNIIILPIMIGNSCIPQLINIERLKDRKIVFTSGFIIDYEKYNIDQNIFLSNDFLKFVKDNGKIYPSNKELYYAITSTQVNNYINKEIYAIK